MKMVPHSRPVIGNEELAAVTRVLRSGQLSRGPEVAAFEKEAARKFGLQSAAAVSSGTAALHLALAGLRLGPGDEVILPTFVCTALLHAVHYVGAVPVLADVRYEDGNIEPREVARRVTPRTKAILVAHMWGMPADIKALLRFGLPVVEDCAQSAGAKIGKHYVGSLGRAGVLSFYATKMMAAGEGGMLMSSDKDVMAEARELLTCDHKDEYRLRFNYKMTDLQAALGRVQLKKLNAMAKTRRKTAADYTRILKKTGAHLPRTPKGVEPVFYRYVIKVPDAAAVIALMKKKGVNAERPLFRPLHDYLGLTGYPNADRLFREAVSLPLHPSLTKDERTRVMKTALDVLSVLS